MYLHSFFMNVTSANWLKKPSQLNLHRPACLIIHVYCVSKKCADVIFQ